MTKYNLDVICFCAFRYALGRSTYIVKDVCDIFIDNISVLHNNTKEKMKEEIREALASDRAGMECDRREWEYLLEILENKGKL